MKSAVTTYPKTDDYDLEEDLTKLATGEAMVTILSERGAPSPSFGLGCCRLPRPMNAIDAAELDKMAKESPLWATYSAAIDRESARELLTAKMAPPATPTAMAPTGAPPTEPAPTSDTAPAPESRTHSEKAKVAEGEGAVVSTSRVARDDR